MRSLIAALGLSVGLIGVAQAQSISLPNTCSPSGWHAGDSAYHVLCGNTWVGVGNDQLTKIIELSRHQPFNYRLTGNSVPCNAAVCGATTVPEITGISDPLTLP